MNANPHADCEYWGLSIGQCSRYHLRVAGYQLRRSRESLAAMQREGRRTASGLRATFVIMVALVGLLLLAQMGVCS